MLIGIHGNRIVAFRYLCRERTIISRLALCHHLIGRRVLHTDFGLAYMRCFRSEIGIFIYYINLQFSFCLRDGCEIETDGCTIAVCAVNANMTTYTHIQLHGFSRDETEQDGCRIAL